MNRFGQFHPSVLFCYFLFVMLLSMFFLHPLVLIPSLFGAILFYSLLVRPKVLWKDIVFYTLLFLLFTLTNPLFSHKGKTILFYLNDQAVTFESIVYGAMVATMIISVLFWCKCYQLIMTTDKFLYLFGKALPRLSLTISMAIRFIPLYRRQVRKVRDAQKCMGIYQNAGLADKLLGGLRTIDSVLGWAIENAVDTADSMSARGYGRKKRTNFTLFRFRREDGVALGLLVVTTLGFLLAYLNGIFHVTYYPEIKGFTMNKKSILETFTVMIFMLLPAGIESEDKILWKYFRSRI